MHEADWIRLLRETGSRREFLALSSALTGALALRGMPGRREDWRPRLRQYPFTLGVASGDPTPDRVVLWTRLAPEPHAGGGMPDRRVSVDWELAADESFRRIVRRGSTIASPELAHSVHVELRGLEPARPYWYRFFAGGESSPAGRTFTAPRDDPDEALRFVFCSCQHYEQGLFTAYRHMADEDITLVVHVGDYIYENGPADDQVRRHDSPEIFTLADYRNRYALYKADPDLRMAHAAFPFIVTWDDHEVDNNYAGAAHEGDMSAEDFLRRRAAAYQAYWEHQPLRSENRPRGPDMPLYRRFRFGRNAELNVLDTRQYRTDQPCGDGMKANCTEAEDPRATMLGEAQRRWLFDNLRRRRARWNVLAHQIPIAPVGRIREAGLEQSMDKWAGYIAERDRLLDFFHTQRLPNVMSIVGDVHVNWLSELHTRFYDDAAPVVGTELVATSISSGGDGRDTNEGTAAMLSTNPHVKFFNGQRGYVRCDVTAARWTTAYRVVPTVTQPDSPISTRATFVTEDGRPGAEPA